MNKIRLNRIVVAGLVTFLVWVFAEIVIELGIGRVLLGGFLDHQTLATGEPAHWGIRNTLLNILIGILNCTLLVWLYASLRPMFGVGTRTALITSAFGISFMLLMIVNGINLGWFPAQAGLLEWVYEAIEFPLAMIAGGLVYEGAGNPLAAQ